MKFILSIDKKTIGAYSVSQSYAIRIEPFRKEVSMLRLRRMTALIILIVFSTGLVGCFTIRVGGKAELAASTEEGTKIAQKRFWYALWGLVPLGDNSTDRLIPENVKKVRVETKYTVPDFLINIFTGLISIETFTTEVYEVK